MCSWLQTSHHPLQHQHLMGTRPFQLWQEWMKFGFWTVASKVHFLAVHLPSSSSFLMDNVPVSLDHRWGVKSEDLVGCHLSNSSEEVLSEVDVFTANIYKNAVCLTWEGQGSLSDALFYSWSKIKCILSFSSILFPSTGCLKLIERVCTGNSFCLSLSLAALVPRRALTVHVTWGFSHFWTSCPGLAASASSSSPYRWCLVL